eukprot:gene9240-12454_t
MFSLSGVTPPTENLDSANQSYQSTIRRRKGKWIEEEEILTKKLIEAFNEGYLKIPTGTTLRSFLSDVLGCEPMRITKKFTGSSCVGKQLYSKCNSMVDPDVIEKMRNEIKELEQKFWLKLQYQMNVSFTKELCPLPVHSFLLNPVKYCHQPKTSTTPSSSGSVSLSSNSHIILQNNERPTADECNLNQASIELSCSLDVNGSKSCLIAQIDNVAPKTINFKAIPSLIIQSGAENITQAKHLKIVNNPHDFSELISSNHHMSTIYKHQISPAIHPYTAMCSQHSEASQLTKSTSLHTTIISTNSSVKSPKKSKSLEKSNDSDALDLLLHFYNKSAINSNESNDSNDINISNTNKHINNIIILNGNHKNDIHMNPVTSRSCASSITSDSSMNNHEYELNNTSNDDSENDNCTSDYNNNDDNFIQIKRKHSENQQNEDNISLVTPRTDDLSSHLQISYDYNNDNDVDVDMLTENDESEQYHSNNKSIHIIHFEIDENNNNLYARKKQKSSPQCETFT